MDKKRAWFIAILFFSGLCLTLYPFVSNLIAQSHASQAIAAYDEQVAEMDQEQIDAAKEAVRKYNEQLNAAVEASAMQGEDGISYLDLVDVGESIGFIEIPKIDVYLPIYSGTGEDVLQKGVGHLAESSYPIGGTSTHSVLTGHRGLPSAVLFTDLDKLEVGDTFRITVLDKTFIYEVDQIKTVLPDDVSDLLIDEEKELCTLVTCTPYGINSHRLLVRGHRIESEDMRSFGAISDAFIIDRLIVTPVVAMPIILLLILYVCFKPAKRKLPINDEGELI